MKHTTSRSLYDYWNNLRGKRPAPARREIAPKDIKDVLSQVFILECEDVLTYRFRLAGTNLCTLFGQELRGKNLLDQWSRHERESIEALLYSVTEDAAAAVLGIEAQTQTGQSVSLEMLLLPLKADDNALTRIMGSISFKEAPSWYGFEPITSQSIKSLRLLWPDHAPRFIVQGQASTPVLDPPLGTSMPARRVHHLKVIEGGLRD